MTEAHKHPPYLAIWGALIALTVVELIVAKFPDWMSSVQRIMAITIILLIGLALTKAALVALYFMHLRFEKKTFVMVVSAPLFLALVLVLALLPDVGRLGG